MFMETGRRIYNLIGRTIHILFTEGPYPLWVRILNRLNIFFDRFSQPDQKRYFSEVYAELLTTAIGQRTAEYVPISGQMYKGNASVKLIAFYLPQFHPIPENDEWWEKGFTEWTNVSKALPQFVGHYQPHLPGELGFYDLRVSDIQKRQVELAKLYGIHGFCFYYYWFNGKRLLEYPLKQFMNNPNVDFPFCICWANENWTRRWDGHEGQLLIGQKHSSESDMKFIQDVAPILKHKNYIRIDGRPILIVYRANILPDPINTVKRWKEYCHTIGLEDVYLIAAQTFFFRDPTTIGFDAAVQFPPHSKSQKDIKFKLKMLNPNFKGSVVDYADAWPLFAEQPDAQLNYKLFYTVFPGWDNEPRRPGQGYIFAFSTPEKYKEWLSYVMKVTMERHDEKERIVFINAWNEWAEGAHLEPDRRFGYAYLQATTDALKAIKSQVKK